MGLAANARYERSLKLAKDWHACADASARLTGLVNALAHPGDRSDGLADMVGIQRKPAITVTPSRV